MAFVECLILTGSATILAFLCSYELRSSLATTSLLSHSAGGSRRWPARGWCNAGITRTWTLSGRHAKCLISLCGEGWGPVAPPVFKTELRGVMLRGWFDSIPSPPSTNHLYGVRSINSSAAKIPRRSKRNAPSRMRPRIGGSDARKRAAIFSADNRW